MNENLYAPSSILTLWQLIFLLSSHTQKPISVSELSMVLASKGTLGGSPPFNQSVLIGVCNNFITIRRGTIALSDFSKNQILPLCEDESPNISVLCGIIANILLRNRYIWLSFFHEDVEIFKSAIPQKWIEILLQADLLSFDKKNVINWWSDLLSELHKIDESILKEIGDIGEMLTLHFERNRLSTDGFSDLDILVRWISRINNSAGFDISSIKGNLLNQNGPDRRQIRIEVKSSTNDNVDNFRFKVSKNEYRTALTDLESYYFYCWPGIEIEKKKSKAGPFIIQAKSIIDKFPKDTNRVCEWTECAFTINLKTLQPPINSA